MTSWVITYLLDVGYMGNTSLVDAGYREMTELIFLEYAIKYQKVQKVVLVLDPDGDERKKHKVTHTGGSMYTMHIDDN